MHDFLAKFIGADMATRVIAAGLNLSLALLILVVGIWLAARLANFSQRSLERASVDITLTGFLRKIIYGGLVALIIVVAMTTVGISTAPLVAVLGAAGLAIGLSLQGSLSNLAWGVLLVLFRPFRIGDFVTVGGIDGTVHSISLMHTTLFLPDGREAIMPNGKVGSDAIVNYNRRGTRRFDLQVGIGYKDDIGAAMAEIKRLFDEDERILKDPAPGVWTSGLGESSVDLLVRGWTTADDFWQTKADFLKAIKDHFDKVGISIPFPQRELTVIQGGLSNATGPDAPEKTD
ncbi:MAG: mechanosensitive ion channel [Pseudomonadota bacterium]|nr:mechanosensitive ion channel [Pseudomonadota bacterium]